MATTARSSDPQTLLANFRAKYPGAYDDLSDEDLAGRLVAKFPGSYDEDLAPLFVQGPPTLSALAAQRKATGGNVYGGVPGQEPATNAPSYAETHPVTGPIVEPVQNMMAAVQRGIQQTPARTASIIRDPRQIAEVASGRLDNPLGEGVKDAASLASGMMHAAYAPVTAPVEFAANTPLEAAGVPEPIRRILSGAAGMVAPGAAAAKLAPGGAMAHMFGVEAPEGAALQRPVGGLEGTEGPKPKEEKIIGLFPSQEAAEGKAAAFDATKPEFEHVVRPIEVEGKPTRYTIVRTARTEPTPAELGVEPHVPAPEDPVAGGKEWSPFKLPPEELAKVKAGADETAAADAEKALRTAREARQVAQQAVAAPAPVPEKGPTVPDEGMFSGERIELRKAPEERPGVALQPTREELRDLRGRAVDGALEPADVPKPLEIRIAVRKNLLALAEKLPAAKGQVGRYRTVDVRGAESWMGVKSQLPVPAPKGLDYGRIESLIRRGLAGEPLEGASRDYFGNLVEWATRKDGPISPDDLGEFLATHKLPVEAVTDRAAALERKAIAGTAEGDTSFDFGEKPSNTPTMEELRRARSGAKEQITELSPAASENQRRVEGLGHEPKKVASPAIEGTQQDLGLSKDRGRAGDQQELGDTVPQIDRFTKMEQDATAALADLRRDRKGTVLGSLGGGAQDFAEELPYLAVIGAAKIGRGAVTFAQFSKSMLDDFPEHAEHIKEIWEAARKHAGEAIEDAAPAIARAEAVHPPTVEAVHGAFDSETVPRDNPKPGADLPPSRERAADGGVNRPLDVPTGRRGETDPGELRGTDAERAGAAPRVRDLAERLAVPPEEPGAGPRPAPSAGAEGPVIPETLSEPLLRRDLYKKAIDAAGDLFLSGKLQRDKSITLSDQITRAIRTDQVPLGELDAILEKHGISHEQFAEEIWRANPKAYGRGLQVLSNLERQINRLAESGVDVTKESTQLRTLKRHLGSRGSGFWRRLDGIRRALLVTQVATSVRNFESQGITAVLNALDETVQAGMQKTAKGLGLGEGFRPENTVNALDGLESVGNLVRATKDRKKLEALLDEFPAHRDRLFGSYASDIETVGKKGLADRGLDKAERAVQALNVLNTAQEHLFRRGAFLSKLAQRVKGRGQDFEKIFADPARFAGEVSKEDVQAATDHALKLTFAESPKSDFGRAFVKIFSAPGISLITPFPRFMTNALKYQFAYSPLGFLKLLSTGERQAIAAGNMKVLSQATIGTGLLGAAFLARKSDAAGEKWYEFKAGDKTIDIRPFNPFASYFFAAELLKRKQDGTLYKIDPKEILQGIASVNLRAGTGLSVVDHLTDGLSEVGNWEKLRRVGARTAGEVLAGLLTPLQTVTDIAAHFDPELQKQRDTSDDDLLGPTKKRIPLRSVQGSLQEAESPTREATPTRPNPLLRQLGGITTVEKKNAAEKELDRLQFDRKELLPSSGEPRFDRTVARSMGPAVEQVLGDLVQSEGYLSLDNDTRALVLSRLSARIRRVALKFAQAEEPDLYQKIRESRLPSRLKAVIQEVEAEDARDRSEPDPDESNE